MKTKFANRIFSFALVFVMVLGILPSISIMVHAAADYDVDVAVNHHKYRVTVTWLERVEVIEYAEGGGSQQTYPYYGNIISLSCTGFSETENAISFDLTVFYKTVGTSSEQFTVSIDKYSCGEAINETITVPNGPTDKDHWRGSFQITRSAYSHQGDATCVTTANCTVCGESYIDANNHNPVGNWLWENDTHYKICGYGCGNRAEVTACTYSTATCVGASTCTACAHEKSGIDPNAHSWDQWTGNGNGTHSRVCTLDSSHTENGNCSGGTATCADKAACDVCGQQYGDVLAHSTDKADDRAATCTEPAYCSVCGKEYGMALGHSTDKADDRAATCTEPAYCSVCGEEYGEALGHSTGKADDRPATHTTLGYCSVCQQEYGKVDPDAHEYSNGFCDCGAYEPALDSNNDGRYEIGNAGQLYWFAAVVNKGYGDVERNTDAYAELTADIVVNENVLKADGSVDGDGSSFRPWTPIGDYYSFTGEFDGNGHTISGLYCNYSDNDKIGLFGAVNSKGLVKNLGVINSYFCGNEDVGAIAGKVVNNSQIMNCFNTSTVTGDYVGGIVGWCETSGIDNCYNTGNIIGATPGRTSVGGVAGYLYNYASVTNSFSVGNVTCGSNKAGVIGAHYNSQFSNCFFLDTGTSKYGTAMSAERFASGEVAYLLNGSTSEGDLVWGQTIGTQSHPVLGGAKVYLGYDSCNSSGYTNNANAFTEKLGHILTYTASGNIITESCSANCGYSETATISAENATYNGTEQKTATVTYSEGWTGGELTVSYENNTNAGTATASIAIGGKTASVKFTIAKAAPKAEDFVFQAPGNLTYDGETKSASVSVKTGIEGMGKIFAVMYYNADSSPAVEKQPVSAGNYFVQINVAEGDNYTEKVFWGGENWVFSIGKAKAEITVDTTPITVTYGETVALPAATANLGTVTCDKTANDLVNAGTYTVTYAVAGTANYDGDTRTVTVTIKPKTITETDVKLSGSLTYNGKEQTQQITVTEGIAYTVTGNKATEVGDYTLTVTASGNYTGSVTKQWSIGKAGATVTAAPTPQKLTYNGEAQNLINGGEATGGEMQYSTDNQNWSITIPQGTAAGKYTVYYKVVGDANHSGTAVASVEVTIAKADYDMSGVKWDYDHAFLYDGNQHTVTINEATLPEGVTVSGYTGHSALDVGEYNAAVSFRYDDANYNQPQVPQLSWAIRKDYSSTENTDKVADITEDTVTPEDKTDLENAKADLEKALEENGECYTEDQKKVIREEIDRIDSAITALENVENVTEVITQLPESVEPDNEAEAEKVLDAKEAYEALTDHEKSLVGEDAKKKLDDLVTSLTAYDIVKGDGSSWTKDSNSTISFTANGAFSKFVGIQVDGVDVDKANYEAKAGSTIIALKASYLDTLKVGEHTITVVYNDGSTDGTFKIVAKPVTPPTGDDFNIALYGSLMVVSVIALVVLLLASKKRKYAK